MIVYCRRCDLGFCEKHVKNHEDLEGHELVEDNRVTFCAICTGIYLPSVLPNGVYPVG